MSIEFDARAFAVGVERGVASYEATCARALDELANAVVDRARAMAPVDTGELRSSIAKGPAGNDGHGPFVDFGTNDPVGIYQEFGTSKMPPHPFMRPALAEAPAQFGKGL